MDHDFTRLMRLGKPAFYVIAWETKQFEGLREAVTQACPGGLVAVLRGEASRTLKGFYRNGAIHPPTPAGG